MLATCLAALMRGARRLIDEVIGFEPASVPSGWRSATQDLRRPKAGSHGSMGLSRQAPPPL